MSKKRNLWIDQTYLKTEQYKNDANLDVRQAFHRRFNKTSKDWPTWLFNLADLKSGDKVLDAGCGNARLWQRNYSLESPVDLEVTLLDLSLGMVQIAQETIAGRVRMAQGIQASAMKLPLANLRFNRIFANHMLYHVPDPAMAIAEFARVLSPHGKLIITLNAQTHMIELWELVNQVLASEQNFGKRQFLPEDAEPIIQTNFEEVNSHTFENILEVDDPNLLWAYVVSTNQLEALNLSTEQITAMEANFKTIVNEAIETQGYFNIQSKVIVFVCSNS